MKICEVGLELSLCLVVFLTIVPSQLNIRASDVKQWGCDRIYTYIFIYSGDLLTALSRMELKNTLSGNFQKSEINNYNHNFGMCNTPS